MKNSSPGHPFYFPSQFFYSNKISRLVLRHPSGEIHQPETNQLYGLQFFILKLFSMAEFKRRTLTLSTGKQIKLYGNSIGVSKSLEVAEGYAPNIFSYLSSDEKEKPSSAVSNPHQLTAEEMYELADYSIRLWLDLKDNIRKHGVNSPKVFNSDALR